MTRPTQNSRKLIINITFTTPDIGVLDTSFIDEDLSTLSDHEVVVCDLANLDETVGRMGTS